MVAFEINIQNSLLPFPSAEYNLSSPTSSWASGSASITRIHSKCEHTGSGSEWETGKFRITCGSACALAPKITVILFVQRQSPTPKRHADDDQENQDSKCRTAAPVLGV